MSAAKQSRSIMDPEGRLVGESRVSLEELRRLYEAMVSARVFDHKASAMQRQGRLATYASYEGQEAAQIGAAAVLEPDDWLVATYRDAAAMWLRGYPWSNLILGRTGDERGGHSPDGVNVLPPSITVGGHMIHAVGIAWAEKIKGTSAVAMTMFGDGATSEGDFHEAMNFAAVYKTPTVFFCQNNGWAISMPRERQTASETIADKAIAYGMPGIVVDGNDVLAVNEVAREAVELARGGGGPTLIEAMTYRMSAHTTADDDSRYREAHHVAGWQERDPLERVRLHLASMDAWTQEWQTEVEADAAERVEEAVSDAEALPVFEQAEIFSAMFAEPTPQLTAQLEMLRRDGAG